MVVNPNTLLRSDNSIGYICCYGIVLMCHNGQADKASCCVLARWQRKAFDAIRFIRQLAEVPKAFLPNVSAMRSAVLREKMYQTTQTYERGRTLEFSNKPALRIVGVSTSVLYEYSFNR